MKVVERAAIVTGGGSGIGAASARAMAAEGTRVPQWPGPMETVDEPVLDRILAVNVKGVWLGAKVALLPTFMGKKTGSCGEIDGGRCI